MPWPIMALTSAAFGVGTLMPCPMIVLCGAPPHSLIEVDDLVGGLADRRRRDLVADAVAQDELGLGDTSPGMSSNLSDGDMLGKSHGQPLEDLRLLRNGDGRHFGWLSLDHEGS